MPPVKKQKSKPNAKASAEVKETAPVVSGQLKKKLQKHDKREKPKRGVVFIKHLPHGFFEDQIRRYFEQFGDVTRLRLARSKLTGGSKGFAFVEFEVPEVAEVAAETMDNYLMFNKVVKAAYIPPEKQVYNFFKTSVRKVKNKAGKPIYVSHKTADINRRVKKFNEWSDETYQKRTAVKQKRIKKLNQKYAHLGIDFNSIVTGSKQAEGKTKNEKTENKTGKKKAKTADTDESIEGQKKAKTTTTDESKGKKSKKLVQLEDLLGTTLDDDSDDHDFELESQDENSDDDNDDEDDVDETEPVPKKKRNDSVSLGDLLGDTLNDDDSEDSEYELNAEDSENDEESEEDAPEEQESSDEEKLKQQKKIKPANNIKKSKKVNKPKVDHLDELIKHKKLTGIQKPQKAASKKAKFGKPKNVAQAELTKQLAKPLSSLKKPLKQQNKKQKK